MSDARPRRESEAGGLFEEDESDSAAGHDFQLALASAAESLQAGDPAKARTTIEKALRFRPRHQRARNLLGLSLFKIGELEKAETVYRGLIEDSPADPTLRVNLGLVFLKAGKAGEAVKCFETTLDLSPDYKKAQNYLGLALAQKGEYARAGECFGKAGNDAMAQRMAQQLASGPIRDVAQTAADAIDQGRPFKQAGTTGPVTPRSEGNGWIATGPRASAPMPRISAAPEVAVPPEAEPSGLTEFTGKFKLDVPVGEGGFGIGPSEVVVEVRGEMLTRLDGLVASWGQLSIKPELKRFRGKATDKPFGEGARRILRASGTGRFVISREGRHFTALELGDEPAYFRDEMLFAFQESIVFENGRVPSKNGHDLHLVHLRGRGRLMLVTAGLPKAVELTKGEPLRIPMDQLVGWHGPLIQPRIVSIVDEAPELGVALELSGEGRALVDAPDGR